MQYVTEPPGDKVNVHESHPPPPPPPLPCAMAPTEPLPPGPISVKTPLPPSVLVSVLADVGPLSVKDAIGLGKGAAYGGHSSALHCADVRGVGGDGVRFCAECR